MKKTQVSGTKHVDFLWGKPLLSFSNECYGFARVAQNLWAFAESECIHPFIGMRDISSCRQKNSFRWTAGHISRASYFPFHKEQSQSQRRLQTLEVRSNSKSKKLIMSVCQMKAEPVILCSCVVYMTIYKNLHTSSAPDLRCLVSVKEALMRMNSYFSEMHLIFFSLFLIMLQ